MILPSKHLREDRALIGVGADILATLTEPRSVSSIWETVCHERRARSGNAVLSFDWFILALCFLYAISAVELDGEGLVVLTRRES